MATPTQAQQTANEFSPRILYFISRSNGTLVPLIPADELPFNIRLLGVPRILSPDQIYGLQHVGSVPYTGLIFKPEHDAVLQRSNSQPPMSHTRNFSGSGTMQHSSAYTTPTKDNSMVPYPPFQLKTQHSLPSQPLSAPIHELATTWRQPPTSAHNPDKTQDMIDAIINTPSGAETAARIGYARKSTAVPPSGKLPNLDAKVYCTYWVRHGECDYTQQGCLYKHEMPGSLEELKAIGVKGWPDWWKQKNAQLKFGVAKPMVVGPVSSVADWLKGKKGVESDEEEERSGDESEEAEKEVKKVCGSSVKILKKPEATTTPTKQSTITQPANDKLFSESARKPSILPNANENPSSETPRKPSLTGDLISFASLSPTLTLSPKTTTSSTNPSPTLTPLTPSSCTSSPSLPQPSPKKIFIPAKETPDPHITEFKKREANHGQAIIKRSHPANEVRAAPLQKQIQGLQKGKFNGGLAASKHAVTPVVALTAGQGEKKSRSEPGEQRVCAVRKRVPKTMGSVAGAVGKGMVGKAGS